MKRSYNYDPSKIAVSGVDKMRFELGDTMTEGEAETCALCDEEYAAIIASARTWKRAKLHCLESIMHRFGYEVNTTVGPMKLELQARAEFWKKLYDKLKAECPDGTTVPGMGKASPESGKDGGHYFYGGMHDNENAAAASGGGERNLLFKTR